MNLGEMRRFLATRGIQLTKSLGQNFLHDGNQLRRIAAAGELAEGDRVLEIGPGLGPLTEVLLASGAEVLAIEKDARLVGVLRERWPSEERFELVEADALRWLRENPRDWSAWKLVANLPYSVGSPILVELATAARPPVRLVATLQEEVVDRIAARAGTADYGVLTLLLALQFRVVDRFRVPRDCFFPPPDVESACVTLERREGVELPPGAASAYIRAVKAGFGQRRKMLGKLLAAVWDRAPVEAALARAGVAPTERAERVSREQFIELACALAESPCHGEPGS